ncbi:hypothetical protein HYE82_15710 [Streptomyces sp. BR123]|uniref:hypothetical protein n=1 Tax=Streptomyces sp. BR123 TaxID=2749828 RepID=UPI0015C4C9CD|nr:hypothetical protein [Streptomyces sp. BR123]NXY95812.1 hypothetical protein [Streptomyces sp. BR123]
MTHAPLFDRQNPNTGALGDVHYRVHKAYIGGRTVMDMYTDPPRRVWCHVGLPDDVHDEANAVHESAHAVVAWCMGLTPETLMLAGGRDETLGGGCIYSGDGDAQAWAVAAMGASVAQAGWLHAQGYTTPNYRSACWSTWPWVTTRMWSG